MSDKPPFDFEQFMVMQRAMQALQPPAPAAPAAPTGAITGNGIVKWQTVIITIVGALVVTAGFLIKTSSEGTKEYTTMVNTIERHEKELKDKADKRDLDSVLRKTESLTEDKADKRDLVAIRDKLDEVAKDTSKSNSEVRSSITALDRQISQLTTALNRGAGRVER